MFSLSYAYNDILRFIFGYKNKKMSDRKQKMTKKNPQKPRIWFLGIFRASPSSFTGFLYYFPNKLADKAQDKEYESQPEPEEYP